MRERLCDTLMRMAGRLPEFEPWPKAPEGALKPPGKRPDPRIYPKGDKTKKQWNKVKLMGMDLPEDTKAHIRQKVKVNRFNKTPIKLRTMEITESGSRRARYLTNYHADRFFRNYENQFEP